MKLLLGKAQGLGVGKGRRGVTLLEILVAIAILAFAISAIMQIFPMGFSASSKASYTAIAYELANQKMEEIRSKAIFGGDEDPSLAANNSATYKFFGHRTHPVTTINPDLNETTMANHQFVAFDSADGANVESRYFYTVEMLPHVDITQKSGNFVHRFNNDGPNYGFPDAYRVKVTVRGPVRKKEYAQDEQWVHHKQGAVEATLATIISNKEMGVAYLAYDLVCRYSRNDNGKKVDTMWSDGSGIDSRSIWVTGPEHKRFYPESFTVIRPECLSANERWDTGPAIALSNTQYVNRDSSSGSGRYKYKYVSPSGKEDEYTIAFERYRQGKSTDSDTKRLPNNSWHDITWSRNDTSLKNIRQSTTGSDTVVGGLNLLGQDNIMLVCHARDSNGGEGYYAESNKLIFMCPPNGSSQVVNQYGVAYSTYNKTPYWRFDLLNQVYGRDSDSSARTSVYGSQPLIDNFFNYGRISDDQGSLDLYDYNKFYDRWDSGAGYITVGTGNGTTRFDVGSSCHGTYGYPRAYWEGGTFKGGTVVRFLMQMPTT